MQVPQKERFRQEEIEEFLKEQGLRLNSGLKLIREDGKVVYIGNEEYLERFARFLKTKCQLK